MLRRARRAPPGRLFPGSPGLPARARSSRLLRRPLPESLSRRARLPPRGRRPSFGRFFGRPCARRSSCAPVSSRPGPFAARNQPVFGSVSSPTPSSVPPGVQRRSASFSSFGTSSFVGRSACACFLPNRFLPRRFLPSGSAASRADRGALIFGIAIGGTRIPLPRDPLPDAESGADHLLRPFLRSRPPARLPVAPANGDFPLGSRRAAGRSVVFHRVACRLASASAGRILDDRPPPGAFEDLRSAIPR